MKRLSLAIILACCTLAVAAQEGIQVKCQGAKPTIRDFAQAYLLSSIPKMEKSLKAMVCICMKVCSRP